MRGSALVFGIALFWLAGCAGAGAASEYAGTVWTLERIVGADGSVQRGSGEERLTFGADGTLTLGSCNQCTGAYRLRESLLRVDDAMACTRRGCPEGALELERYVTGSLALRREGSYLVLESSPEMGPAIQLLFAPEPVLDEAAPSSL